MWRDTILIFHAPSLIVLVIGWRNIALRFFANTLMGHKMVLDDESRLVLDGLLGGNVNLERIATVLRGLKAAGIGRIAVKEYLSQYALARERTEAEYDLAVGILDIVEGWCQPKYNVWEGRP